MKYSQLYIHIPYCSKKCIYCDFFSAGIKTADWSLLKTSLYNEFILRRDELPKSPHTIYIGGGTPSLFPVVELHSLVEGIKQSYGADYSIEEFTLEINPEDVDDEKCLVWKEMGVNRVSLGVQSFDDEELYKIGRCHDSARAIDAYYILRRYFDNISVDLMFGLPGQSMDSWIGNVDMILQLKPEHISAYSLMLENRTPLTVLAEKGRIELPDDKQYVDMWNYLSDSLKCNGFRQYEISNYSKPGRESIHNSGYWKGIPYLGLGPSAHSYDGKATRKSNPSKLKEYLKHYGVVSSENARRYAKPFYEEETLGEEELFEEYVMLRMRMNEGINLMEFKNRFGELKTQRLLEKASEFCKFGTASIDRGYLKLTDDGIMKADSVILGLCM